MKIIFDKTGISENMPNILENKLYIGNSAGAMILGHRPSDKVQEEIYGPEEPFGNKNYLDILNFSVLPHYSEQYKNAAVMESESVNYLVYAISDKAATVVNDNDVSIIGNDYLKLLQGKEIK